VHGIDVAISGARQLISGEETSSFTSQGLQAAGVSKSNAELIDAGISIVGSAGASLATNAVRGAATAAPKAAAAAADDVAARAAPRAAPSAAETVARIPCVGNSFAPNTRVLMADGTTKAIAAVRVGDAVMAADPETGERGARTVEFLIVGQGVKQLVDITIDGQTITATDGHPFWVEGLKRWVDANDLHAGDRVLRSDTHTATVGTVHRYSQFRRVNNLSVDDLHTYFVLVGDEAVLVHNTNCATNAKILAQNLTAQGVARPAETAAHHIIASTAEKARPAAQHLANLGVDINEAANGVFLPRFASSANPAGAAVHSSLHTNAYFDAVNKLILQTKTAAEARQTLAFIRSQLLAGPWP